MLSEKLLISIFGKQLNAIVSRELGRAFSDMNIRSLELHVLSNRFGYLFRRPGFTKPGIGRATSRVFQGDEETHFSEHMPMTRDFL